VPRTPAFEGRTDLPSNPISETILDFAEPLLESAPAGVTVAAVEEALGIAIAVWNAVVLEQAGETGLLEQLQLDLTARTPRTARAELHTHIADLEVRKRARFEDDRRLIGRWKIYTDQAGEFRLEVEARASPPRKPAANE
jgi:hypothetical protein